MNRETKIEALAENIGNILDEKEPGATLLHQFCNALTIEKREIFRQGILAGIKLRDAELLELLKLDTRAIKSWAQIFASKNDGRWPHEQEVARWQHEQFIKAIKGSSCDQGRT